MLREGVSILMFVLTANSMVFNIIGVETQEKVPLESGTTITIHNKVIVEDGSGVIEKGKILLPVSIIKDNIFEKIIIDETDDKIYT